MNKPKHPTIAMSPVKSSQIHSLGHSPETNTLSVQFKGRGGAPGSTYHYEGVTKEQFDAFHKADSIGSHFGKNVKGKFKFAKVS